MIQRETMAIVTSQNNPFLGLNIFVIILTTLSESLPRDLTLKRANDTSTEWLNF